MIKKIKDFIVWMIQARWLWTNSQIAFLQQQRELILKRERYNSPKRLNRFEYQVFSQNGEDGIIAEIFRRIGVSRNIFLEIGVENGLENNTSFLLQQGWAGIWIEGNLKATRFIQQHFRKPIQQKLLSVRHAFMCEDNVVEILKELNAPIDLDLLSLDIDRNTYFILKPILSYLHPRVIVVEYSALYPPDVVWSVEYQPKKIWGRTSYAGASLKAYTILAGEYGYSLVGCDLCGVNAFFVKNDLLGDSFLPPYTADNHYEPLRDYLIHRVGPQRRFTDID